MAANTTIRKALLTIANMDQHYYEEHNLRIIIRLIDNDNSVIVTQDIYK